MPIYSHSQLNVYQACPFQYKLHYIDKVEREAVEGVEGFLGTAVHETLRKCYDDIKLSKLNSLEQLLSFYGDWWQKGWHDDIVISRQDMSPEDYRKHGIKLIENYYKHYAPFNSDITIKTEMHVSFSLDNNGKYKLQGYIDRLSRAGDGSYEIHDYKTSSSLPGQDDVDKDRQLALYQIGVQNKWPDIKKVRLVWHYLTFDKEMASTRSGEELYKLRKDTINLIDEIQMAKEFPPRESFLCEWCEYPDLCPNRKHLHTVESLPANEFLKETGVALVNKYAELKDKADEINGEMGKVKEALVEYARKEGLAAIQGSKRYARVRFDKKLKFPGKKEEGREELDSIIVEAGRWMEVSDLNTSALAHAVEDGQWDKDLNDRVMEYGRVEETSTVILSKKKMEEVE